MVISNTKSKNLDIVFCTHVDVVTASSYSLIDMGNILKGRGTFDMKGSVAVLLHLFQNLDTDKNIALFITSDEEITGYCASQLLTIYKPKFAIVPDGGKNFQIVKEEKGQLQVKITCKTKSAHASQPYNGENAIVKLMDIYQKLIAKYPLPTSSNEYQTSINLSTINGGYALNSVPDSGEMSLDIRHTSQASKEEIINYIKSLDENIIVDIIHSGSLFTTDINHISIQKYLKVSEDILKRKPQIVSTEATSDAIYFSDLGIPTILTNPSGDFAHSPNEYIEKDSLLKLYFIWKKFIKGDDQDAK